ncbi:uncharacterized protein [Drosophila bipectinata]|uniref:uncharacterized protein n=1 Tax=Drosophila bipectinata TaxID=42026 RepID=UPI001C8A71B6|nr:uncharacterized protein LOC108133815 [Drosophila bipectinata]
MGNGTALMDSGRKKRTTMRRAASKACKSGSAALKSPKGKNRRSRVSKRKSCAKPKNQRRSTKNCHKRGKSGKKVKSIMKRKCQRKTNLCHVKFDGCQCTEDRARGQQMCLQCLGNICGLAKAGVTPSEMQLVLSHRYNKRQK